MCMAFKHRHISGSPLSLPACSCLRIRVTFQAEERKAVPGVRISQSGSGKNIRRKKGRETLRREHSLTSLTPLLFFLLTSLFAVRLEQAKAEEKKGKETLSYKHL